MTHTRWSGRESQRLTALTLRVYGVQCHLCPDPAPATTADHLVPRSRGGRNTLENLRPAHMSCNRARSDMPLSEWWATHPLPTRTTAPPSRKW